MILRTNIRERLKVICFFVSRIQSQNPLLALPIHSQVQLLVFFPGNQQEPNRISPISFPDNRKSHTFEKNTQNSTIPVTIELINVVISKNRLCVFFIPLLKQKKIQIGPQLSISPSHMFDLW